MKNLLKISMLILLSGIMFMSCGKDDDDTKDGAPLIEDVKAENHDVSGSAEVKRGGLLSVNFKAIARGDSRLESYHIEIHDHPASGKVEDEYKIIDKTFTDAKLFKGLREASVHQHVSVPRDANLGKYHVVVRVVDSKGRQADTENALKEITVVPDEAKFEISGVEVTNKEDGGKIVSKGGNIVVKFSTTAAAGEKLDYYNIEVHDHPSSGKLEDEYKIVDDSFKDVASFKGKTSAEVVQEIPVPAGANIGQYHVVVTVVSDAGKAIDTENALEEITVVSDEFEIADVYAVNKATGKTTVKKGETLVVKFKSSAEKGAKLDYYHVEIHDHPASGKVEDEYKIIDQTFKNESTFKGKRLATATQEIVVADDANLGSYHVVIFAVDENGKAIDTEKVETNITVVE